jgi:hypothetical protein
MISGQPYGATISAIPEKTGMPVTVAHSPGVQAMIEQFSAVASATLATVDITDRSAPALNQAIWRAAGYANPFCLHRLTIFRGSSLRNSRTARVSSRMLAQKTGSILPYESQKPSQT